MHLDLLDLAGLSQLDQWDCKIDEGVSHGVWLASLQVFHQLDGLQGSDAAGGG